VRALVLARVSYGEADLILQVFTDLFGRVSVLARGAKKSQKRFSGALEPMHTLRFLVSEPKHSELLSLRESHLDRPRLHLTQKLENMEAAGHALSWVRKTAPPKTREITIFVALEALLDQLNEADAGPPGTLLIAFGFRLLEGLGFGLDLSRCVSCGKLCPEDQSAWAHPERGGLVCRACGGGPVLLPAEVRRELSSLKAAETQVLSPQAVSLGEALLDRALKAHGGVEATRTFP